MIRILTDVESRRIGYMLNEPFVATGHPLTCNGGNPDLSRHHDHEVLMLLDTARSELICPECGRHQLLPDRL